MRGNPHALGDIVPRGLAGDFRRNEDRERERTAGIGRGDRAASAGGARDGESRLDASFRTGHRRNAEQFRRGRRAVRRIPELLDYLASRLVESGWSMKSLHREIMLSATYQLSAKRSGDADPDNRWFARANVRRLDVESLRDSLLFVGGALDETIGGPPVELSSPENQRRTIYARIRRSVYVCNSGTGGLDRMLQLFDFPDPTASVDHRTNTNVPLQGLFFLNSDLVMRAAERLAARVAAGSPDDAGRIGKAYRSCSAGRQHRKK